MMAFGLQPAHLFYFVRPLMMKRLAVALRSADGFGCFDGSLFYCVARDEGSSCGCAASQLCGKIFGLYRRPATFFFNCAASDEGSSCGCAFGSKRIELSCGH